MGRHAWLKLSCSACLSFFRLRESLYTLLTPTTTFFKGDLVGEIGEVGVSRVYRNSEVPGIPYYLSFKKAFWGQLFICF